MSSFTNISQYGKRKLLYAMEKKRSPRRIEFRVDRDGWFVDVVEFKKKTGEIVNVSIFTSKQVEDLVERYERIRGYHLVDK